MELESVRVASAIVGLHSNDIQEKEIDKEDRSITPESGSEQPKLSDSEDAERSSSENVPTLTVNGLTQQQQQQQNSVLIANAEAEADQAENVLGVSISRAQSRMKARGMPAEEKNRAIERSGSYFDAIPDSQDEEQIASATIEYQPPQLTDEPEPMDTPQIDEVKKTEYSVSRNNNRHSFTKSMLMSSFSGRRRALSGDSNYNLSLNSLNFKKIFNDFNLTPTRLYFSQTPTKSNSVQGMHSRSASTPQNIEARNIPIFNTDISDDGISALGAIQNSQTHSYQQHPTSVRPTLSVRHSMSDESLYLRSLSRVSSMDHRLQYENVHSIVNSRYKAIRDSLQDSSSKIFSMTSFNLPDFKHEWNPSRFLGDYQRRDGDLVDAGRINGDRSVPDANNNGGSLSSSNNAKSVPRSNTIYPILDHAASQMTGDVVVMGGYRGSILRSAKPPHRQLWVPMKVGLNIRKVDLEIGLTPEDEERVEETVIAREVLSHIGPVDICRRLLQRLRKFQKLRDNAMRIWDYGYDWRLSPHLLSKRLIQFLEGLPCNAPDVPREKRGAYIIAHSMGGLITRHAVNQRPDLFAGVMLAGTPQHCVNILGPLRHGDEVLLSSKVLTAQVNFTMRSSYVLLPDDGRCFINKDTKEDYIVDFYDVKNWDEYAFSPCISTPLPPAGNENKKSLMDNLPSSFSTLPKIGLSKRFSVKRNGGSRMKDSISSLASQQAQCSGPQAKQENDRYKSVAGENENEDIDIRPKSSLISKSPVPGSAAGGIMGPNTAKAYEPTTTTINNNTSSTDISVNNATLGACTIPREKALEYLERTLKEARQFRQELAFNETHQTENRYPPFAVMYSKALPTVYGARVASREDIKRTDAYDDLAFAAGDGVCLASAAMLPPGYRVIKNGLVRSDRGHVGLLGDLEGTGRCLLALMKGRQAGVGLGAYASPSSDEGVSK